MLALLRAHVRDERVIETMAAVPREAFVLPELRPRAYDDRALPIGEEQTISQPLMVALMLDALHLAPDDRVLEVGAGSGYQAALLARLVRHVVTVERVPSLVTAARERLAMLGYRNVVVCCAAERLGWPQGAPYDAIVVAAAAPHVPRELAGQLSGAGRMVIPVGSRSAQQLVRVTRTSHGLTLERLGACAFVPLVGAGSWPDDAMLR